MTYLRPIGNESELENLPRDLVDPLERNVRATADSLLNGRWEAPLQISIKGLNLEEEAKDLVESEIRQAVVEELLEDALAQLRGGQPEPEEGPPLNEGATILVSLGGLSMPRSLGGLDLPSAAARRIEARVQRKIQSIVARFVPPSNSAPWPACTCIHNTPTTSFLITAPDGSRTTDLSVLDPKTPAGEPYRIALYPPWYPDNLIAMTASRSAAVVPSDRMIVSLASRTRWPKAIEAWNFCVGRQAEVFQPGPSDVPNEMPIVDGCGPGRTDTLNFNKPGFGGFWHTVLRPNESDFWAMLRGRRADFVWMKDPYTVDEE